MEENKQVVAEWKALNQPRLQEIKKVNPELYSAVNLALQYLNQKLGGEELPAEVEEVEEVVETTPTPTKQWTLDDFKNIKIIVDTPEKSKKFQELFLSLGGEWSRIDNPYPTKPANFDRIYLITNGTKLLYYNSLMSFNEALDVRQIYYDDIFPPQTETKKWTKYDFLNKKIVLDTEEKSKKFQLLAYSLGLMWESGENITPILLNEKYIEISPRGTLSYTSSKDTFNQYTKEEIFYDDIFLGESESTESQTTLEQSPSQSQYKWPIETYPPTLKYPSWNLNFEKNNGDRKSPTQSAGELKRRVNQLGQAVDYMEMILATKFKGNDGNWYIINVGKGGVWTWKQTTPPPAQSTSFTSTASAQSTPEPAKKQWTPQDLVGKQLLWSGRKYDVVKFKRNNPKYKSFELRNEQGIEIEGKLTMSAIERLLNDEPVKGISIIKPQFQRVPENDFQKELQKMTDSELEQLYNDTYAAQQEFDKSDPEYTELRLQMVEIANEQDQRRI